MRSFQELLVAHRKTQRLSQSELARRAGVSPSYINRLERGERDLPSRKVAQAIADALDLEADDRNLLLLTGGYAPEPDPVLEREYRLLGLVTEFLHSDAVTDRDVDDAERFIRFLMQREADDGPRTAEAPSPSTRGRDAD